MSTEFENQRHLTSADRLVVNLDQALRTLFGRPLVTERSNPAETCRESELPESQRDHVARLMRINHTGEVCAQALYQGQALTARREEVRRSMERSAAEENDHLDWCEQRVEELGGRLSLLNPLWYAGSFTLGAAAGLAGDKWSLGFVAETEKQVEGHLDEHLAQVPESDCRTRAILEQMKEDEIRHGRTAKSHGGAELPAPVKAAMKFMSKVMTTSVYRL
ncbi:2-polyprenyl-3-methyl-6-methoxy-1,4-benzoquinone monooxygenase [Thiolapillus brandeum]|uniref:3-demethoxyubiquinol 3-hydroxylase n=1 Tax=Thiolapillus brandeum TaxID=1076588 RepID=A0A7U6JFV6_9GAMM|nr:2-polyprenyl-3-methyl-6-methoxy-1,4-benzoquinone monooxygenase [Thiolapillus brandeum]BAO43101.1 ubiquinone biosynthesis monooxygenase Coq7 [Thiolapillus brandeum]